MAIEQAKKQPREVAAFQSMRPVRVDAAATWGAQIGLNLLLPDGTVGTLTKLQALFGGGVVSDSGTISTTDDLEEGQWNLWFTNRRAQDAVGGILANSANVTLTYVGGVSITADLTDLADAGTGALLAVTFDAKGRKTGSRAATITGTAGRVTVANGSAAAGLPTIDLATVTDAGGGTLQKTAFDAYGRKTGTSAASTADLTEGANLYFTDERAQDAVGAAIANGTQHGITVTYDDAANAIDFTIEPDEFGAKPPVAYAATSALPANAYSNGTAGVGATLTGSANGPLVIDGVTLALGAQGERVLVAAEATGAHNGWYVVTQVGVLVTSPYILTRDAVSDQADEIGPGYLTGVEAPAGLTGGANNGKLFISVAPSPFVVGTDTVLFSAVGQTYTAGTGLDLSGFQFSLNAAAQASLALADSAVQSVVAGSGISVDNTDPQNPVISATSGGGSVPDSRLISTTAPLTGGGDLTADRTLAISAATTGAAGSMSSADKTKLDGIATGATANATDAYLLARANHTGTQAWGTLTGTPTTRTGYGITDAEPTITAGTTAQYWRGDKTWRDFATDVRAAVLTGLSTASSAVITATDTVLGALGKLQAQVSIKSPLTQIGTYASRPTAASSPNVVYYATDVLEGYRSNGTTWAVIPCGGSELGYAELTTTTSTTSSTAVDVAGLSITCMVGERPLILAYGGAVRNSLTGAFVRLQAIANGFNTSNITVPGTGNYLTQIRETRISGLTAGTTYTFKLQILAISGGTSQLYGDANDRPFIQLRTT